MELKKRIKFDIICFMKEKKRPHFLEPKEADFPVFFEGDKAFLDGVEIKVMPYEETKTPFNQRVTSPQIYEDMKVQIFPLDTPIKEPFLKPIETRAYKDVQVTRCQTKEGLSILSVEGQDGVTMCVPGSFEGLSQEEEKAINAPQVLGQKTSLSPHQKDLIQKANTFQSKVKEVKIEPQKTTLKAPYNLADVPPISYGKPRKEGVNLLRVFKGKPD